jgi:hypothetical protein
MRRFLILLALLAMAWGAVGCAAAPGDRPERNQFHHGGHDSDRGRS